MENKNKNSMVMRYIILLIALILIFSSCKKFLEEIPTGSLTDKSTYNTESDLAALTIGPYRNVARWTNLADDWGNFLPSTFEYQTGKAWAGTPHVQLWKYQSNQITGDMLGNFDYPWANLFAGIRDCNFSIEVIQGIKGLSATQISRALGEIRTLRAWYYFNLVRYFGDVPMVISVLGSVEDAQIPRTSLKKIYDEVIVPDLEFAVNESNLENKKSTDGRITKYVAGAILADVYLTMAGYPYQEVNTDPEKKWCEEGLWTMSGYPVNSESAKGLLQKAKGQLDVLYGKYTLGSYSDLHKPEKNNTGEAIFQAQYLIGTNESFLVPSSLPMNSSISMWANEFGSFVPTVGYINSYNPADKRAQERQFFFTSDRYSKNQSPTEEPAPKFDRPYLFKFYDSVAVKVTGKSQLNWTFYRYADILLLLTEVNWSLRQLGISVSDGDITKGINEVRNRALLPAFNASDVTLKNIMSERAYELIFENKMIWDQRRTRMCLADGNGQFTRLENFIGHSPVDFSFSFGVMNLLSPMPGKEILNNKKCLQNFGHLPKQTGVVK